MSSERDRGFDDLNWYQKRPAPSYSPLVSTASTFRPAFPHGIFLQTPCAALQREYDPNQRRSNLPEEESRKGLLKRGPATGTAGDQETDGKAGSGQPEMAGRTRVAPASNAEPRVSRNRGPRAYSPPENLRRRSMRFGTRSPDLRKIGQKGAASGKGAALFALARVHPSRLH